MEFKGEGKGMLDSSFKSQETHLVCLVAFWFLNVNLTLNFHMISVQNTSRNDQALYSIDDWAVVQLSFLDQKASHQHL